MAEGMEEQVKRLNQIKFLIYPFALSILVSGIGGLGLILSSHRHYTTPILELPDHVVRILICLTPVFPAMFYVVTWEGLRRSKRFCEWAMEEHIKLPHELRGNLNLFSLRENLKEKEKLSEKELRMLSYLNAELNVSDVNVSR